MKFRWLSSWLLALGVGFQLQAQETLNLEFKQPSEAMIDGKQYPIKGSFVDGQYLAVGAEGLSLPAKTLVGENQGTILFGFKLLPLQPPLNTQRVLMHLRTASRLTVGFNYYTERALQFSFSDREKTYMINFKDKLEIGRDYQLGVTWDGSVVRVYLDGRMVGENVQPVAVTAEVRDLNLGPYKDGWIAPKPWSNDTLMRFLRVYNTALTPEEIAKLSHVEFKPLAVTSPMTLTVPPLAAKVSAPQIDGKLDEDAWKFAASMPRLIYGNFPQKSGMLPPHGFRLTCDAKNLYLGFDTLFPGRAPVQAGEVRTADREPEVWGSESFEFYIHNGGHVYRFAGNVAGGSTEWRDSDAQWSAPWSYATTQSMKIDDSILWQGEVAIPWSSVGLDGPPKQPLPINFCRSWKLPEVGTHSSLSLSGGSYNVADARIDAVFGPTAVIQTTRQNDPANGEYVQEFTMASAKGGKVDYDLALARLDGSVAPMSIFNRAWTLAPGEPAADKVAVQINAPGYDCLVYTFTDGNRVAMREIVPFKLNEEFFTVTPLFLKEKLLVGLKQAMLKGKFGANFKGELVLTGPDGKVAASLPAVGDRAEIAFPRSNTAGQYKLELVNAADHAAVGLKELSYPGIGEWEKLEFPADRIIPPFTPMVSKQTADSLETTLAGRTYVWRKSLLPTAIASLGEELLLAPAELLINGQPVAAKSFTVASAKPHRVEFAAAGGDAAAKVSEQSWLEYDGVQWNSITIEPQTTLNNVAIRYTLPTEFAKYLHGATGAGWGSKVTRELADGASTLRYYPVMWLGNEEKGLCFFAESRADWNVPDARTFSFDKGKDKTVVTVHVADKLEAGKPFRLEFGFLASPVRPLPANYPLNTLSWSYNAPLNRPGQRPVSDVVYMTGVKGGDLGSFFGDIDDPDGRATAAAHRKVLEQCAGHDVRPIPYTCARYLSVKYPEMAAFKEEWVLKPEIAMDYENTGHFVYDCCPTTGASAYFVWRYKKMLEKFPGIKGIYFDFGSVGECSNPNHGCNRRVPLLGLREFYRRIALAQLDAGIKDPVTVLHNTDCVLLPAYTFATHLLNGEQVRQASSPILHNKKDILDTYGADMFACELGTLPFGIANSVYMPFDRLSAQNGGDEAEAPYKFRMTKAAMAGTLIHNTMLCLWRNHYGIFDKVVRVYDKFGVPEATFVGYWKHPAKVVKGDDIYVSVYVDKAKDKVLAVVAHMGKPHVDQDVEIVFDWAKLGIKNPPDKAVDTMTAPDPDYQWLFEQQKKFNVPLERAPLELGDFGSKIVSFDGRTLKMKLAFHSFAIVELTR